MRAFYILPPILFLCLGALFFLGLNRENPNVLPSEMIGRNAPQLDLEPIGTKQPFDHSVFEGEGIKVLNVFASWCVPCRAEHPQIQTLADLGLPVYGMNYKDRPEAALAFLNELGDPYTAIGADSGRNGIEWGVYGVPETFLIGGDGKVLYRYAGPITRAVLETEILPLIQ